MKKILLSVCILGLVSVGFSAITTTTVSARGKLNTARFSGMEQPSSADLFQGLVAVAGERGLHPGVGGNSTAALTDGNGNSPTAVLNDSPDAQTSGTSTSLTFTLPAATDIGTVIVFTSNGDGRAFQDYDVEYATAVGGPYTLITQGVRSHAVGESFKGNDATDCMGVITKVFDNTGAKIAIAAREVKFTFHGCDNDFALLDINSVVRDLAVQGANMLEIDALAGSANVQEWSLFN